jgi:hypothetical protein
MDRVPRFATLIALSAVIVLAAPAGAATRAASFGVSAQVVGRTSLQAVDEPAVITLSVEDLALGYKDVDAHYRVHATRAMRYLLSLTPLTGLTDSIRIDGLGAPVVLELAEVAVSQPAARGVNDLRLRFRLALRPSIAPGTYALPVRLSVSTI